MLFASSLAVCLSMLGLATADLLAINAALFLQEGGDRLQPLVSLQAQSAEDRLW